MYYTFYSLKKTQDGKNLQLVLGLRKFSYANCNQVKINKNKVR